MSAQGVHQALSTPRVTSSGFPRKWLADQERRQQQANIVKKTTNPTNPDELCDNELLVQPNTQS